MHGRAFDRQKDIRKLQVFLAEMRHQVAQAAYFQFGDLMWRMHFLPNGFDGTTDIRIWSSDDGEICGFVFYLAPDDNPEFFLRPELYDSRIADEMISWAVARALASNATAIETSCIDSDTVKTEFLKRVGFQPLDDVMVFMERQLDDTIPACQLPNGYSIVSQVDHLEVVSITGRRITREQNAHVCNAPGYKNDLGLRVCHQNQRIVGGCICWYDDIDNCGEFEPVGINEEHRRKGLAFAVMAKTMENLKKYGADMVYVRTGKDNAPAIRLYQKLGFDITHEDFGWKRSV